MARVEQGKLNGSGEEIETAAKVASLDELRASKVAAELDLAAELLLPNPESLATTAQQLTIQVVAKPGPLEFFRCHPTVRLTLKMLTPNKGELGAHTYAVLPAAEPLLARYRFEPHLATLYPIVIDSRPPVVKLVMVKLPQQGRDWDNYNLSKKVALDMAVEKWVALRPIKGGYEGVEPHPDAVFPDPIWPDYSSNDWLNKSLGAADLVIRDASHDVFRAIQHL